jgi:translation initiation factor 3 subunit I
MLHGHERSITQIKYNRDGDLLFSVAKDTTPTVWYSLNGERLGTYDGHSGALWCIDISRDCTRVLTGSADNTCRLWDCETGRQIAVFESKTAVRSCGFNSSGQQCFVSTDKQMGHECEIMIFDVAIKGLADPCQSIPVTDSRVTAGLWSSQDRLLVTGHENGDIRQYDPRVLCC